MGWRTKMPQRRLNEQTACDIEYALFLAEIRGIKEATTFSESCGVARTTLVRVLDQPALRRTKERRAQQRHD
jgi:hypothetical protein